MSDHTPYEGPPAKPTLSSDAPSVSDQWAELAEADWKRILDDRQYHIARNHGTERPFSGKYWKSEGHKGVFKCVACQTPLFTSEAKFFSACGWPAFKDAPDGRIAEYKDTSHGMVRVEVRCQTCDAHLGHVFNDGPPPTGLRYCINSESIVYDTEGSLEDKPLTPEEALKLAEAQNNAE